MLTFPTGMVRCAALMVVGVCGLLASVALGGPLNPPAGPVASTPGPEPRIAVNLNNAPGDANSLFRIVSPGSYYLTGNVSPQVGRHGIEIAADNVVLDLMGFTVGNGAGPAAGLHGITSDGTTRRSVTVRNGTVGWFTGTGVAIDGTGHVAEALQVRDCGGTGISMGGSSVIRGCTAVANAGSGLNAAEGSTVIDSTARQNTLSGIVANRSTISRCSAVGNGGDGIGASTACSISDCTTSSNANYGISVFNGTLVTRCSSYLNTLGGFEVAGTGAGASFIECTSYNNSGVGIKGSSATTIIGCTVTGNDGAGVSVSSGCTVRGNQCRSNGTGGSGGSGILATGFDSVIEGNTCTSNADHGVEVTAANNLIISNRCSGNLDVEFSIAIGNRMGTILIPGPNAAAVNGSTYAAGLGTTDPWANISY